MADLLKNILMPEMMISCKMRYTMNQMMDLRFCQLMELGKERIKHKKQV